MRIFVSSTSKDLHEYRQAVIVAINRLGYKAVAMEYFTPEDTLAVEKCLKEAREADLYIGVIARRYGFIPRSYDVSITELEYRAAVAGPVRTLMFLLDEDMEWPEEYTDSGELGDRLQRFRNELKNNIINFFTTPNDLCAKVTAAIANTVAWQKASSATRDDVQRKKWMLADIRLKLAEENRIREDGARERVVGPLSGAIVQFFKDRVAELRWLRQQVAREQVRLILVCGRGGVGKTSLVSKFLYDIQQDPVSQPGPDEDGVESIVYVALRQAQYRSPDKIMELICRTLEPGDAHELEERWRKKTPLSEKLEFLFRRSLGRRRCLLVLDNCEDVLDEDNRVRREFSDLEHFIQACVEFDHRTRLIVTSRRTLVLSPEMEGRIGSRRVELRLGQGLPASEAAALLRDLDTDGSLGIQSAEEASLQELAQRCYGIPRTIETIVGTLRQKRTWTLRHIEQDDLLARLLSNPARELYESLSADEKLVVQALAVYDRPIPSGAVMYLLPGLPLLDLLDDLVRNYVVAYADDLFSLHPLDRQYAYGQVPETGDGPTKAGLHRMAAEFYLELRKPPSQWKAIEDLEPQLQEFHHLTCAGLYDRACSLLNEIDREHLALWGHTGLLIDCRGKLIGCISDLALQGLNWGNLGVAIFESGDPAKAIEHYERALAIASELGDRSNEGRWTGNKALALRSMGRTSEAIAYLERALGIATAIGDRKHEGRWTGNLGDTYIEQGRLDEGVAHLQRALAIARETGDRRFERIWLARLGSFWASRGKTGEAITCLEQACAVAEGIGDRRSQPEMLLLLGEYYSRAGEPAKEREIYARAVEWARQAHNRAVEANAYLKLALICHGQKKIHDAVGYYERATEIACELGNRQVEKELELRLAQTTQAMGQTARAIPHYERALSVVREMGDRFAELSILTSLGTAYYALQEIEPAIGCYKQALAIARQTGNRTEESIALFNIGDAWHTIGDLAEAARYYEQALVLDEPIVSYKCAAGLGVVALQQGRKAKAETFFTRCVDLCQLRLQHDQRLYPEYSTLALALVGLGKPNEGLTALRKGLACAPTKSHLYYALQDLLILARVSRKIPCLDEAVQLVRTEWESTDESASH